MADTLNLGLPLIAGDQAQKHITHNEALVALDAVVQLSVLDRTRTSPPGSPANGDRHIVAAGPSGAWSDMAGRIAMWIDGSWEFYQPREGWHAWVVAEGATAIYTGSGWSGGPTFFNLTRVAGTLSSDTLTVTSSAMQVLPQSGNSDALVTIAGGVDGSWLVLNGRNGDTITVTHATGNVRLAGGANRTLTHTRTQLVLIRVGTEWCEISYANNG
jgi:hypothetical protein